MQSSKSGQRVGSEGGVHGNGGSEGGVHGNGDGSEGGVHGDGSEGGVHGDGSEGGVHGNGDVGPGPQHVLCSVDLSTKGMKLNCAMKGNCCNIHIHTTHTQVQ